MTTLIIRTTDKNDSMLAFNGISIHGETIIDFMLYYAIKLGIKHAILLIDENQFEAFTTVFIKQVKGIELHLITDEAIIDTIPNRIIMDCDTLFHLSVLDEAIKMLSTKNEVILDKALGISIDSRDDVIQEVKKLQSEGTLPNKCW